MIKLTDLLKELNIQSKDSLGQGGEHTVYPSKIKPGFVIKKFTADDGDYTKEEWREVIETSQQHPDIFAQIDKVDFDKRYVVQEKLDEKSLTKDLNKLDNFVRKHKDSMIATYPKFEDDLDNLESYDILTLMYITPELISILDYTPYEKTLKPKLKNFFDKLENAGFGINDNPLGDLRITNVGYDKNREIKILDFNFGEL